MMMFWLISAAGVAFLVWYFIQDCDFCLKFWSYFGASEDGVLHGKVAFITGAGSGIGKALALRWASKSVRLALNDFNESALLEVKKNLISLGTKDDEILLLPGDVTDEANHKKWMSDILGKFKQLDILVNNAGRVIQGPFAQVPFAVDKAIFDVNVMAPVGLTKVALPHFLERNSGYVVQLSSVMARFPSPMSTSYGASKAAVLSYFSSLRTEVLKDGVSVTVVCPGPVQTNIITNGLKLEGFTAALQGGHFPKIMNGMSKRRCAELISKAMVNKIGEAWISSQPVLFFAMFHSWVPTLTHWFAANLVVPLMGRFFLGENTSSKNGRSGRKED